VLPIYFISLRVTRFMRREGGQTTAEYALVILAAAAVAVVLIAWAHSSGKLPAFFNHVIDQITGKASGA
jgi:Flp pilus assembly pilin Flp